MLPGEEVDGMDGSGGAGGCCGVCGENSLAGAGAVRHALGAMLENRKTCDQPDRIDERGRVAVCGGWVGHWWFEGGGE